MENKNEKKLAFAGRVLMEPYTDREGVKRSAPAIIIDNPFDADIRNMRVLERFIEE